MVALLNQYVPLAFLFSGNASSTFGSISHSGGVNICNVSYVIIINVCNVCYVIIVIIV